MPLRLLLDENISPVVASEIGLKRPEIDVVSLSGWRQGAFLGVPDEAIVEAALEEARTLVTYDTRMLTKVAFWFDQGTDLAGIIFVDASSIPSHDFGALIRALTWLWDRERHADWHNRIVFLPDRAPS